MLFKLQNLNSALVIISLFIFGLSAPNGFAAQTNQAPIKAAHGKVKNEALVPSLPKKRLRLKSINTGEEIDVAFWKDGAYLPEGLDKLNHFLRDHRDGHVTKMDPELFMIVHRIYDDLDATSVIEVISGHRSKRSNEMLRSMGRKVAKNSQHILGKAMDFRIPDIPLIDVRDKALSYGLGGVGYYKSSNFVHVDTGRPRRW